MQYAKHSSDALFASWRRQPLDELEGRILSLRRIAASGVHLTQEEWKTLDRMRKYVKTRRQQTRA
jgi:hypothetical protein